ncbi:serine protease inhibitor dipetalogastin [Solenopsis invicta]|uniref:serine protease inhibitor dipetalogastin n=1 Tax=Solenopsis invicta TaxID=13686 RepID=UPI0005963C67|nr:serine protease inhibitor dipetalogastin [Solenopsis invicta]
MLFYLLLITATPFLITAQNSDGSVKTSSIDSFVFDGPVASRSNGEQSATSASATTAASDQYDACVINCPVTPEYNPVCGTDNIVYNNPELLSCAIRCGKKVTLNYYGRCNSAPTTTASTTIASVTLPNDDQYNACVMNCPITSEYNPVCGTDSIDYINPGLLSCAARCGKEVTLNYYGRCSTSRTG